MLLKIQDVKQINVPHYKELNVKDIYEHYKSDPKLMKHLPDNFAKGRQIDRTFFFNIFNTLYPEQLATMIQHSRDKRFDTAEEEIKRETITITEDWRAKLMAIPFKSSKLIDLII